ncbi:MAG: DUF4080 domain-containing protein [Proteobacteria bacterium]|nr:DUF4080 domain-containing protein [Pseudomonadota bacterium]
MVDIVLATANARYSHSSLALRTLLANLGDHRSNVAMMEFTIDERPADMVEKILDKHPRIVGLSVSIWNVVLLTQVVELIKQLAPEMTVVVGGPEVSFEVDDQRITQLSDHVVTGEGEGPFEQLCTDLLLRNVVREKVVAGVPQNLEALALPYDYYDAQDIANRVIYLEASRGCPYGCEFCLSCLDTKVRKFPNERVIEALAKLWDRGVRRFKFIDRSLHLAITDSLMSFFAERADKGVFVHFELVPDRLPKKLLDSLAAFPTGAVQLEAGVQTLNDEVAERIGRKQNPQRVLENLQQLHTKTGAHIHCDLVAGLPGESLESFASGFDRLISLDTEEIQVGILKRLRGAPISRHNAEWEVVFNREPPYDILQNKLIDFATMQRIKRFARYFDLIYNSGNFASFSKLILGEDAQFERFLALSDWLFAETRRTKAIALNRLAELLFRYVTESDLVEKSIAANCLFADFARVGRKSFPGSVRSYVTETISFANENSNSNLPPRQQRHAR